MAMFMPATSWRGASRSACAGRSRGVSPRLRVRVRCATPAERAAGSVLREQLHRIRDADPRQVLGAFQTAAPAEKPALYADLHAFVEAFTDQPAPTAHVALELVALLEQPVKDDRGRAVGEHAVPLHLADLGADRGARATAPARSCAVVRASVRRRVRHAPPGMRREQQLSPVLEDRLPGCGLPLAAS